MQPLMRSKRDSVLANECTLENSKKGTLGECLSLVTLSEVLPWLALSEKKKLLFWVSRLLENTFMVLLCIVKC